MGKWDSDSSEDGGSPKAQSGPKQKVKRFLKFFSSSYIGTNQTFVSTKPIRNLIYWCKKYSVLGYPSKKKNDWDDDSDEDGDWEKPLTNFFTISVAPVFGVYFCQTSIKIQFELRNFVPKSQFCF